VETLALRSSRGAAISSALATVLALGAFLAAVASLFDLILAAAPFAACAPPFGFADYASGLVAPPKLWMSSQMRVASR
jgi:hypothetical protein